MNAKLNKMFIGFSNLFIIFMYISYFSLEIYYNNYYNQIILSICTFHLYCGCFILIIIKKKRKQQQKYKKRIMKRLLAIKLQLKFFFI